MAKLKRFLAPEFWKIPKKKSTWAVTPRPGPHKKFECIPLLVIVRDILGLVEKGKEGRMIIKKGEILVDGKQRKDPNYPVGLMDVVSIPKLNKHYRIVPFSKGLKLIEIPESESRFKILRIRDKRLVKGARIQLNFHDGKNLFVDEGVYSTGDSVLVELPSLKILDHFKLDKDALGLIIKGKNAGKLAKVLKVVISKTQMPRKVICECENKKLEVLFDYFFVVGKDSPAIKVSE
jgi:small subunit ribosomal protein S4e